MPDISSLDIFLRTSSPGQFPLRRGFGCFVSGVGSSHSQTDSLGNVLHLVRKMSGISTYYEYRRSFFADTGLIAGVGTTVAIQYGA